MPLDVPCAEFGAEGVLYQLCLPFAFFPFFLLMVPSLARPLVYSTIDSHCITEGLFIDPLIFWWGKLSQQ